MRITHTKSTSGKTHRLTLGTMPSVTIRYETPPEFDDQVQGDLIRKYRHAHDYRGPIGILSVSVDPLLEDSPAYTPQQIATATVDASGWNIDRLTRAQVLTLIAVAVQADRGHR